MDMSADLFAYSSANNPADNFADSFADSFEALLVDKSNRQDSWLVAKHSADSLRATPREGAQTQLAVEWVLFVQKLPVERWSTSKLWRWGKPLT